MNLLVIIPAHNEEKSIVGTINDLQTYCPDVEYIVINDGSTDNTELVLKNHNIKHITLPVNVGLAGAIQLGYKLAYENGYDAAVQFDGDGQHKAKYINEMFDEIKNGYDIVIGSRFVKKRKSLSPRMLGSRLIGWSIMLTTFKRIKDPTSGMRMVNRAVIKEFAYNLNRGPEPDTIAYQIKKKRRVKEIQVSMREREHGASYLTLGRSIHYMLVQVGSIIFIQPFRPKKIKAPGEGGSS